MTSNSGPFQGNEDPRPRAVEGFARDLLALIRGVRVYPAGHQFLTDVSQRLVRHVEHAFADPLVLGVTPDELTLEDAFIGGRYRRSAELAVFLHGRRIGRVVVRKDATAGDLVATARSLSDPRVTGAALRELLAESVSEAVTLEPLQLEKIHEAFREEARDGAAASGRGQDAWHWLLDGEITPGRVAELLTAETTWEGVAEAADDAEATQLTALLFRVGDRLSEALDGLPAARRSDVQKRLAEVGKRLSPRELATLLRQADTKGVLEGPMGDALEEAFGGDKLLDLLAGLVVEEGLDTRRLSEVYARFSTIGKIDDFLSVVRERMATGDTGEFTAEVWGTVESFLLSLQESPFMGTDYSATLESVAARKFQGEISSADLTSDLEAYLDAVMVGLGIFDAEAWAGPCLDRLEERLGDTDPETLLGLIAELETGNGGLLERRSELVEKIFHHCVRRVRLMDENGRRALVRFAQRHEACLLGPVFRALLLEEQITVRRFLVDVVSAFSPAVTPSVVSRLRSSPWYVTRNLTIAMGRRGEETTLPVLQSLLHHDHAKVRREAIIALGRFRTNEASQALAAVVHSSGSSLEDRTLAARAMEAAAKFGEHP